MSDSSRVQLRAMPETVWGTIPATALTNLRFTSENLKHAIATTQSEEIRSDRQITDLIQTSQEGSGGFNFEMSYDNLDALFEGIFMESWSSLLTVTDTDISAANSDNSFNSAGAGFPAFVVGQWVRVAGFTDAANNGFFKVVSRTSSKLVVTGAILADESAGDSVTIDSTQLRNGVTEKSFVIEKEFADVGSNNFHAYTGMEVQNFNLSVAASEIATGSLEFLGKTSQVASATTGTGAANTAPTNSVMNAMNNIAQVRENDAALPAGVFIQELSIALANNLRGRPAIGVVGHSSIGRGRVAVTGSLTAYFSDGAMYSRYIANTASSISFRMTDAEGNSYIFTMPKVKFTDGEILAGGVDQDVMVSIPYQALMDPTEQYTLQLNKFSAA